MTDLRDIVNAATPGPWRVHDAFHVERKPEGPDLSSAGVTRRHKAGGVYVAADARFIATFDPTLVSALLDVVEAARNRVKCSACATCADHPPLQAALDRLAALESAHE